jgi:hypothetical protein
MAQIAPREAGLQIRHYIASADRIWLERFMHEAYSHRRVKLEWFRLSAGDVEDFSTISEADNLDQLPSWVVARRVLNEANGFAWGERDDDILPPCKSSPRIVFNADENDYAALLQHMSESPVELKLSAIMRRALRLFLESVGKIPTKPKE